MATPVLKSFSGNADCPDVITAAKIMDRGRLLLGLLLVAPVAAVVPTGARSADGRGGGGGSQWTATTVPNPIKALSDPKDVVAALTKKTIDGQEVVTVGDVSKDAVVNATKAVGAAGEVGSDGGTSAKASDPSPATPPGPVPVQTPAISNYVPPPNTTFVFPVVGGASFTNDWGGSRPGGKLHHGIDFFAKEATPVVAEIDGVVFRVGWNNVGGWRYWLRDQWGNEYYHAHLSAFAPAAVEGSQVKAGTVLGYVGNTGDAKSTPPHMHYEIHPAGGEAIPPFGYVSVWQRVG